MKRRFSIVPFTLCILLFSLLTACGFHLRGHGTLPVDSLYLQADNLQSPFLFELRKAMKARGLILEETPEHTITLLISEEQLNKFQTGSSATTHVEQEQLTFSFLFQLFSEDGQALSKQQKISSTRSQTIDKNKMLSSDAEKSTTISELHRESIHKLFRRLRAPVIKQSLIEYHAHQGNHHESAIRTTE